MWIELYELQQILVPLCYTAKPQLCLRILNMASKPQAKRRKPYAKWSQTTPVYIKCKDTEICCRPVFKESWICNKATGQEAVSDHFKTTEPIQPCSFKVVVGVTNFGALGDFITDVQWHYILAQKSLYTCSSCSYSPGIYSLTVLSIGS